MRVLGQAQFKFIRKKRGSHKKSFFCFFFKRYTDIHTRIFFVFSFYLFFVFFIFYQRPFPLPEERLELPPPEKGLLRPELPPELGRE
jgi:hypothetical protein